MDGLSEEQIQSYRVTFALFDKNNDGTITTQEMTIAMRELGLNPSEQEVRKLIKDADTNADKKIDFGEFCGLLKKHQQIRDVVVNLQKAFKEFDANGDGFISREELRYAMTRLGESLSDKELDEMVDAADVNKDGKINYAEFASMYSLQDK